MQTRNRSNPAGIVALAVLTALGLSGCGGGSSQGSISVADVSSAQARVTGDKSPCPFPFDVAAAAESAGVTAPVTPGAADGTVSSGAAQPAEPAKPLPSGMTPNPTLTEIPAVPAWTNVECPYRIGEVGLEILVVATPADRSAINFLLPVLRRDNEATMTGLESIVRDLPKPGDVRMGPGAVAAAVVRVPVKGSGDVAMLVSQESGDGVTPLSADAMKKIAGKLASEVRATK